MMAVVVDERDAACSGRHRALHLEAPVDARELGQRFQERRIGDLELGGHGDSGERVQDVVRCPAG